MFWWWWLWCSGWPRESWQVYIIPGEVEGDLQATAQSIPNFTIASCQPDLVKILIQQKNHQNDAAIISTRLWSTNCCPDKETPKSLLHVYKTNQSPAALSLWLFKHKSFHDLQYIRNINIYELFCQRVWSKIGMTGQHICICIMYIINIVFNELKYDLSKLPSKP